MTREQKAKLSIEFSLLCQFVSAACGFVIPRLLIDAFGSEVYGVTTSIAQFLSYITLIEGGIGVVARAALYKPLADRDDGRISRVYHEIQAFFRNVALVFIAYTFLLAFGYKYIAHLGSYDLSFIALLVVVISISTLAQYYFGITNFILIQADQRQYINSIATIITTLLNTLLIMLMLKFHLSIIAVKFASSCAFLLKPLILALYVKRHYSLKGRDRSGNKETLLTQKKSAFGQHLAYFVNSNTDVFILTLFAEITSVSIYSVYNLVVATIRNLVVSGVTGMEAFFGNMIAKKEDLNDQFAFYETYVSMLATVMLSTTTVMVVPFMRIYMRGVTDADYIQPVFSLVLTLAYYAYCLREPYTAVINAAGHIKSTRLGAYGEVIINVVVSVLFVIKSGLVGVAIGTLMAMAFRIVYYAMYLRNHIMHRRIILFMKRELINIANYVTVALAGEFIISRFPFSSFLYWFLSAFCVGITAVICTLIFNGMFYKNEVKKVIRFLFTRNQG